MKPTSSRLIPNSIRIAQRETPGSLTSVHEAALLELAAGNLKNAWALLQEALGVAMLQTWRELSGRPGSQVEDRQSLLLKLYNRKAIDKWTLQVVREALKHPHGYDLRRVDILAGIVRSFVFDKPAEGVDEATTQLVKSPVDRAEEEPTGHRTSSHDASVDRDDSLQEEDSLLLESRYPSFPLTEFRSPRWQEHEAALASIGVVSFDVMAEGGGA